MHRQRVVYAPHYTIMKSYDVYNLILCLIVFVSLTALFSYLIVRILKLTLQAIENGLQDQHIVEEYHKQRQRKESPVIRVLDRVFPVFVCALLGVALCFSLYTKFTENDKVGRIPTLKVVETGSMEYKHQDNLYLYDYNLNDQISMFDLIVLHPLPKEEDLKVFDTVVYKINGYYIVHRIVDIEEPNENHPNERWFVLRGDANKQADDFPVRYSQMVSIYKGERVPFLGSFVIFMQSPAGMLCFLLVLFAVVSMPIVDKKVADAKKKRLAILEAAK